MSPGSFKELSQGRSSDSFLCTGTCKSKMFSVQLADSFLPDTTPLSRAQQLCAPCVICRLFRPANGHSALDAEIYCMHVTCDVGGEELSWGNDFIIGCSSVIRRKVMYDTGFSSMVPEDRESDNMAQRRTMFCTYGTCAPTRSVGLIFIPLVVLPERGTTSKESVRPYHVLILVWKCFSL